MVAAACLEASEVLPGVSPPVPGARMMDMSTEVNKLTRKPTATTMASSLGSMGTFPAGGLMPDETSSSDSILLISIAVSPGPGAVVIVFSVFSRWGGGFFFLLFLASRLRNTGTSGGN